MRVIIVIIVFVLLILGLFFMFGRDHGVQEAEVIKEPITSRDVEMAPLSDDVRIREAEVREKTAKAGAEMRVMVVALSAYKIDNNALPDSLYNLTTPIAYILKELPVDPFTRNSHFGYRIEENGEYILWSIGPDGIDNDGKMEYDRASGLTGSGDIIFRQSDAPSGLR